MNVTLHNLRFAYDHTPVLSGISEEIGSGAFVTLIGPNGCGKSTLIKCINGILNVQDGAISLNGKDIRSWSSNQRARHIAYVPQNEQRMVPLPVFDTVLLGRRPYVNWRPSVSDMQKTAETLEKLHLEEVAMKDVRNLSGGQQQRVFIARALNQEPDVLLLDEPTANLDLKHQLEVLELLQYLSGQGITIIMALHDINLASMYGDRVLMMKEGSILASGGSEKFTAENIEKLYDVSVEVIQKDGYITVIPKIVKNNH